MSRFEQDYRELLSKALITGQSKDNRTGVRAFTLFNETLTIKLNQGFPILTGKQIFFNKALHEYRWIVQGLTHLTYLHQHGIFWWDEFADEKGYLGKTYGYQLRSFNGLVDQLDYVHREIRGNSRRAHITLWNPSELNQTMLPPCYTGFTFVRVGSKLNMTVQMRSSDMFLGLPYDIIVCTLLLYEVAIFNELEPDRIGFQISDGHIYDNHIEAVNTYLSREILPLPTLYKSEETREFELFGYEHKDYIFAPLNK